MKKAIFLIPAIIIALAGCTEDKDKFSEVMDDMDVGGAIPYTIHHTPKFFDVTDIANASINYDLKVGNSGEGSKFVKVKLYKSYMGGDEVLHAEYLNADIPYSVTITATEALAGLPGGETADSIEGGDYIDWVFEMEFPDGTAGEYQNEALGTFPDFRSYFASTPDFDITANTYTTNILLDGMGLATPGANVGMVLVGGTAKSQYIMSQGDSESVLNAFGLDLAYRILYIGNNTFIFFPAAEGFLSVYFGLEGTIVYDPGSGNLTVTANWSSWSYGPFASQPLNYELIPD